MTGIMKVSATSNMTTLGYKMMFLLKINLSKLFLAVKRRSGLKKFINLS